LKIIFITFYYEPDLGAGSFRASALVDALLNLNIDNLEVEVITTHPNRYKSQDVESIDSRLRKNLKVHRINLPDHNSGLVDQAYAFCFFAYHALRISRKSKASLIVATSSRLMTAFLGYLISKFNSIPLYLDIRDIFTDVIKNVGPKIIMKSLFPIFSYIEKITFKRATHINLVSKGFTEHVKKINPNCTITLHTNGIDSEFIGYDYSKKYELLQDKKIILYAGNIGEGQGLHKIIPKAAKHLENDVIFKVIGDGGMRTELEKYINEKNINNVELLSPMSRSRLLSFYKEADILFLHLNNYEAFTKVIPSKLFEYSSTGKPILAGLKGVASNFIKDNIVGVKVFNPCDEDGFLHAYHELIIGNKLYERSNFLNKYSRESIMNIMANEILQLSTGSKP